MNELDSPSITFLLQRDVLSSLFDPFQGIDIARVYLRHASLIDFVIYFILFTGVTRATLGKRFTGKPGRLISLAVGLILAIALSVTQHRMHFNIASFGPYAAAVILCLAAVMFHQLLLAFGVPFKVSLAVSYIVVYASIRSFVPPFFDWLLVRIPFLAAILTLAFFIALMTLLISIWPRARSIEHDAYTDNMLSEFNIPTRESFNQADLAEKYTRHISVKENEMFSTLKSILHHLPESMRSNQGRLELIESLNRIQTESHKIFSQQQKMRELDRAILQKDLASFRKIAGFAKTVPPNAIPKAIEALQQTRQRINLEKTIETMEPKTRAIAEKIQSLIGRAVKHIEQGDSNQARRCIGDAIQLEKPLGRMMDYLTKLERALKQDFEKACGTMKKDRGFRKKKRERA